MRLAKRESFGLQVFGPSNYQRLKQSLNMSTTILPPDSESGISQFVSARRGKRIQTHVYLTNRLRSTISMGHYIDRLLGPGDLFEEVGPLLPGILEGIHVCIFAYGQTGPGLSGRQ